MVDIDRVGFGGDGVAHAPDGRVLFVRGGLPGDRVEVVLDQVKKRHLRGRIGARVADGPQRQPAFCPHADACGGCPWQGLPLAEQHAALHAHVSRLLGRAVGGDAPVAPVVHVPPDQGWRSTARLHWREGAVGFRPAGTHGVLAVERCPVLRPEVTALLDTVRRVLSPALTGTGTLRLTADAEGGTVAVHPNRRTPGLAKALARLVGEPACRGAVLITRAGAQTFGTPGNHLGPEGVWHPADGFVQAHQPGNTALVEAAVGAVGRAPEGRVLELFAGSGNFTFALARAGRAVLAVERQVEAAKALEAAARAQGLADVRGQAGDAARLPPGDFACALIDPPRAGAKAAVAGLHARGLEHLVYVSCDPATLARDVGWLAERGWRLTRATPFDLFPHTGHVEVLAELNR